MRGRVLIEQRFDSEAGQPVIYLDFDVNLFRSARSAGPVSWGYPICFGASVGWSNQIKWWTVTVNGVSLVKGRLRYTFTLVAHGLIANLLFRMLQTNTFVSGRKETRLAVQLVQQVLSQWGKLAGGTNEIA